MLKHLCALFAATLVAGAAHAGFERFPSTFRSERV